jgi:hypothetical protein
MTENEGMEGHGFLESKMGKTIMVILSVFLIFAGPTYIVYGLNVVLKVNTYASFAVGLVLFVIGMVLMWQLVKKKIVT